MVIRTRLRAILLPLALYAFSGSAVSYFVWHASHGQRGLEAKETYIAQMRDLRAQLADAKAEREAIALQVGQFQTATIDRDLLDEEAHRVLGRAHRNELVVTLADRSAK